MNTWIETQDIERYRPSAPRMKEYYRTDDFEFAVWMHAVNLGVQAQVGLGVFDLEDFPYHDAFSDDCHPDDVAAEVVGMAMGEM